MFGYIKPDEPNMFVKDTVLYRASYCSLCKGIGACSGEKGRIALSYDLTFLNILLHNLLGIDLEIKKEHCVLHVIKKRPIAKVDKLTKSVGALNVILTYYKCIDDIMDSKKGGIKKRYFSSPYKKAKKLLPELDLSIKKYTETLRKLEKENSDSIDEVSDCFSKMMEGIGVWFLADNSENTTLFFYSLGKWVYLIDALDDIDKDVKKKEYNVFYNKYKIGSKKELIDKFGNDIRSIFASILSDINACADNFKYNFNHDLIDNVLKYGLKKETMKVMEKK